MPGGQHNSNSGRVGFKNLKSPSNGLANSNKDIENDVMVASK